eukprot:s32_g57.t1
MKLRLTLPQEMLDKAIDAKSTLKKTAMVCNEFHERSVAKDSHRTLPAELCPETPVAPTQMSLESARQASVAFLILASDYFARITSTKFYPRGGERCDLRPRV